MGDKIHSFIARLLIAHYERKEAKAEAEYSKRVTDFYENGIGWYGEHFEQQKGGK